MDYIRAFLAGGVICALVQILMEKTKMMPRPYYGPFSSIRCDFRCHRYLRALQRMGRSRRQRSSLRLWKHPVAGCKKSGRRGPVSWALLKAGLRHPPAVLPQPLCLDTWHRWYLSQR